MTSWGGDGAQVLTPRGRDGVSSDPAQESILVVLLFFINLIVVALCSRHLSPTVRSLLQVSFSIDQLLFDRMNGCSDVYVKHCKVYECDIRVNSGLMAISGAIDKLSC